MPKIRENSRLERTHGSPDPILESDNKSGSDLQEKESPPMRKKHGRPPRNFTKILQDNNWDSVVDLIFRRTDDSPVLDALNSFGLEFGLPIMKALDAELSKDLIYSDDEEEILPPESQEKESGTQEVKQLGREEKRTEKNKRKRLRRKKKKNEWKKEHSTCDISDDDDDEQGSKEEENGVEKPSEEMEEAHLESSATLTDAATAVGNNSEKTDKANPDSSATSTPTENASTGVGSVSETTHKTNPDSSATPNAAAGLGNDNETTDKATPESSVTSTLNKTTDTGVVNDSEITDQGTPESSVDAVENDSTADLPEVEPNEEPYENVKLVEKESLEVSTAGSPIKNQLDETHKPLDEPPKLQGEDSSSEKEDSSSVDNNPEENKLVLEKTEEAKHEKEPQIVKQKIKPSKTGEGRDDSSPVHDLEEKLVQEKSETEETKQKKDTKSVKQKTNPSKTSEGTDDSTPVVKDLEEKKSVQEKAETEETKPKKDPKQKIKCSKTPEGKDDSSAVHDPEENKLVREKAETEEAKPKKDPKLNKQKNKASKTSDRKVTPSPVHEPEVKKTVQEKTEETKPKKGPKFDKQKIKPSKTSDQKETNNIEGSRKIVEPSLPSPLLKKAAIGGFSNNSGCNDDISVTKEGDGNLEPTVKNMEVVPEHLAKKSTELAAVGNRFAAAGQYEAAIKCYTDAIKFNPQEFKLFGNRSLCYERMRDYEKALADARLALHMEPKWLKGLFRKGKALCGLKRYFEASLVYKEILQQETSSAEAAQELKRAQTLHLMEMGFTWGQSSEALKNHATLEEAIDALFGSEGRRGRSDGRRSQSAEHDVSQDKRMEEMDDEDNEVESGWIGIKQVLQKVNTPTSVDRAKSESPTPRDGVKARSYIGENCDLWVGSLAPTVTKMKLFNIFGRAGTVANVTMISNQQYAFVKYTKKEDCDKAINMLNGMVVEGSPLLVRPSNRSRF